LAIGASSAVKCTTSRLQLSRQVTLEEHNYVQHCMLLSTLCLSLCSRLTLAIGASSAVKCTCTPNHPHKLHCTLLPVTWQLAHFAAGSPWRLARAQR
jgi:hypothetical protein